MSRWFGLGVLVAYAAVVGCGRSPMDTTAHASGSGGSTSTNTGATGGSSPSGPCGDATCLTELFATCEPAGDCTYYSGSSPSAVFGTVCYTNGVTMSYVGGDTGSGLSSELTVRRAGVLCYSIASSAPPGVSGLTFVIRDGNGRQVATAATADKNRGVTVTCEGRPATTVDSDCLVRIGDTSACTTGLCP
jgi:hypothetical protein